jgi:site-specific DNA-cytosine methylase
VEFAKNEICQINVLSLFDGISTLHLALDKLGISVNNYYASEIERDSISISNYNFPNVINLGDINNWKEWDIDWDSIDVVAGGSPCQSFSIANQGNRNDKGFEGKSKLFFVYLDILNHIKDRNAEVKFLLENVKMKKEWRDKISSYLEVAPILIDSEVVSAQHRERYYWCNWNVEPIIKQKNVVLNNIVDNYTDRYFLSDKHHKAFMKSYNWKHCELNGKGKTIIASYFKQPPHTTYIPCKESPSGFRRLTPLECERVMTLPDNYTKYGIKDGNVNEISDTGRYRAVGNGWTLEVIKHIFSNLIIPNGGAGWKLAK